MPSSHFDQSEELHREDRELTNVHALQRRVRDYRYAPKRNGVLHPTVDLLWALVIQADLLQSELPPWVKE